MLLICWKNCIWLNQVTATTINCTHHWREAKKKVTTPSYKTTITILCVHIWKGEWYLGERAHTCPCNRYWSIKSKDGRLRTLFLLIFLALTHTFLIVVRLASHIWVAHICDNFSRTIHKKPMTDINYLLHCVKFRKSDSIRLL